MAFEIDGQLLVALGLAAKRLAVVNEGVVIELDEGFELNTEHLAIMQQRAVMVRNAPGAGIEIIAGLERAGLRDAADFHDLVAAAHGIVPAAGAILIFEHFDSIARALQFIGCDQTGQAGAEYQHLLIA